MLQICFMRQEWFSKTWVVILLHIAAWMIVFSLPYLLISHYSDNTRRPPMKDASGFFYLNSISNLLYIGIFYLNAYVLTPRFIIKKKYLIYIGLLIVLF